MRCTNQKVMRVSLDKSYNLLEQNVHGEIRIVDPWEVTETSKERFEMRLNADRRCNAEPFPQKILAYYTTTSDIKKRCLQSLLRKIFGLKFPDFNRKPDEHFEEHFIKTPKSEEMVGKQPYWPYGQLGNLYRIEELFYRIQKEVNDGNHKLKDYLAVFILSIESDIDDKRDGPAGAIPHDQPNMMIYECFSGQYIAGVGCGPGVQEDLLAIAKESGFIDEDGKQLAGKLEYGKVLARKFRDPTAPVDSTAWHNIVSPHPRDYYFERLSDEILATAEEKFSSGEIDFHFG